MTTRLVRFFGDHDRDRVAGQLTAAVAIWATGWFSEVKTSVHSIASVKESALETGALNFDAGAGRQTAVFFEPFPLELFLGSGSPRGGASARRRLEEEMTRRAIRDLVEQIIGPVTAIDHIVPGKAGEGFKVVLGIGQRLIEVSFTGACFHVSSEGHGSRPHAVRPLLQKAQATVAMRAVIGQARIPLAELFLLAKGDVIALDTRLDGATRLESEDGSIALRGILGSHGTLRAIKIGKPQ